MKFNKTEISHHSCTHGIILRRGGFSIIVPRIVHIQSNPSIEYCMLCACYYGCSDADTHVDIGLNE